MTIYQELVGESFGRYYVRSYYEPKDTIYLESNSDAHNYKLHDVLSYIKKHSPELHSKLKKKFPEEFV